MEKLFTTTEAARITGVSPGRVRQMVADNILPFVRVGRDNLLTTEALEIIKGRKTKRGPDKGFKQNQEKKAA